MSDITQRLVIVLYLLMTLGLWVVPTAADLPCLHAGDPDGDGQPTPADALLTFRHFLGREVLQGCQQDQADVWQPHTTSAPNLSPITPADALCIFQMFLTQSSSCLDAAAPIITPPGNQRHAQGATVRLAITVSAAPGASFTFSASGLPTGLSINSSTGEIAGTIDAAAPSTSTVTVTVSGGAREGNTTFLWEVILPPGSNAPPVAHAGPDQFVTLARGADTVAVTLDGSGSTDSDGTIQTYSWAGTPAPAESVRPSVSLGVGVHVFTLVVVDDAGASSLPDTVTVTVSPFVEPGIVPGPCSCRGNRGEVVALPAQAIGGLSGAQPMRLQGRRALRQAAAGIQVTFTVTQGDGGFLVNGQLQKSLTVSTDANGVATAPYTVGMAQVQEVRATRNDVPNATAAPFNITLGFPSGIAVVLSDGGLVVADLGSSSVLRVDPVTGAIRPISDARTGSGPPLIAPYAIAFEAGSRLLVADLGDGVTPPRIIRVDATTGQRTVVSGCSDFAASTCTGQGPFFGAPVGMAVERSTGTLVVVDRAAEDIFGFISPAVLRVDLATGDRAVVSANFFLDTFFLQSDLFFGFPSGIAVDASGALIVVDVAAFDDLDNFSPAVLRVHPLTGERQVVSANIVESGSSVAFGFPTGIAVGGDGTLLVVDAASINSGGFISPGVLRVNPLTGERTPLSTNFTPDLIVSPNPPNTDVLFRFPTGIAVETSGALVVADASLSALTLPRVLRVDPGSGDRVAIVGGNDRRGTGARLESPTDIAVHTDGTLLVLENPLVPRDRFGMSTGVPKVVQIDMQGNRTEVSSNTRPSTDDVFFGDPRGIAVPADGTVLVLDAAARSAGSTIGPAILSLNRVTGDRTLRASNDPNCDLDPFVSGQLLFFGNPVDLAAQSDGLLWVLDRAVLDGFGGNLGPGIWRVDPSTCFRLLVSSNGPGNVFFGNLAGLTVRADGSAIWVADNAVLDSAGNNLGPGIWQVDPQTGNRLLISTNGLGTVFFSTLEAIAVQEATGALFALDTSAVDTFGFRSPVVWLVDPTTGIRLVVSSNSFRDGAFFVVPLGLAVQNGANLVVVDTFLKSLIQLDLASGERTIVSK